MSGKPKRKSSSKSPSKRAGKNGGTLQSGNPGNKGGSGRPPSFLREQLRGSYADRMRFLDLVIDGEVMQRAELPLAAVLPHVVCPNCGEGGQAPKEMSELLTLTFDARISASVKDRISALEHQAKYGLGALKEVSVENVRERVGQTLDVIRQFCTPDVTQQVINALRSVWA